MTNFIYFLQNAEMLNDIFNIVPLLYGSLGLEVLTKSSLSADDIDILIPQVFVTGDKWTEFKLFWESYGYTLIDEHEHTFRKDGVNYSYASVEGLKEFADIDICDIEIRNISGTEFMLLSLEQYLKVYQKSSQDGYRMNVKEKQDNQKIEFIKKKLYSIKRFKATEFSILPTLSENSYREITVGVEGDNTKARYMYEKYGFTEPIARIKESYQDDSYEYDLLLKR